MWSQLNLKIRKKHCVFYVVPGNGQALLGMLDTAALNILNLNIDSIQAQVANCRTENRKHTKWWRAAQTQTQLESSNKNPRGQNQSTKLINYFYSSKDSEADKRQSNDMTQKYITHIAMFLMALGASKAHFHYSLNLTASHTKHHQGMWHMHYRSPSKKN